MTRPTDAAVARAFYEACEDAGGGYVDELWVIDRAKEIDAEPQAAEPYDRCPKCTAHMPVGKHCGGKDCGIRRKDATE